MSYYFPGRRERVVEAEEVPVLFRLVPGDAMAIYISIHVIISYFLYFLCKVVFLIFFLS